ncbi:hypothetical protein ACFOY4_33385 [Actinomadura syzygii]|uniref:Restriction endonuclease type IV Mrr domain-containing protein n=1 Tax=Actinomadura syzygii TaxID=1427538 RepID=A0A5D0UBS1_9ACTN|nr:hypothetical protein [Actinomadura syzygii]TYC15043.1 hypothetical protein FXF65_13015 [Actinomadura syzygii]
MTGRVPWERYEGDDIEAVIAIMLLREIPHGQRIRPSKGDGGIDILVPHGDGSWEVYQVKGFTASLNASQKRQITKSWNRLLEFTSARNISLRAWHVVRPLDPTHPDRDWLAELTEGRNFPCDWIGLTAIDGLAAKYPEVVDYYLLGEKERVLEQVKTFLAAASFDQAIRSGSVSEPAQAIQGLIDLHNALNKTDPHYRYEIHVEQEPQDSKFHLPHDVPGLVFSTMLGRDGTVARIDVIARYNEATKDRPISVNVTLRPETEEQRAALKDFLEFGTSVDMIPAEMIERNLPGGFSSHQATTGSVSFLPTLDDLQTEQFDLVVMDNDGRELATTVMNMSSPTSGLNGSGAWSWEGKDVSGVLDFGIRHSPALGKVDFWTKCNDITGLKPSACLPALQVLSMMVAGVTIELRFKDGPPVLNVKDIPEGVTDTEAIRFRVRVCTDLAELQKHVSAIVRIPNASEVSVQSLREWADAADLLRDGVAWRTWNSLCGVTPTVQLELPARIRITKPLKVKLLGRQWELGLMDQEVIVGRYEVSSENGESGCFYPSEEKRLKISIPDDREDARQRANSGVVQTMPGVSSFLEAETIRD